MKSNDTFVLGDLTDVALIVATALESTKKNENVAGLASGSPDLIARYAGLFQGQSRKLHLVVTSTTKGGFVQDGTAFND